MYVFKLYVTGNSLSSQRAIANARQIITEIEKHVENSFEIIDLIENPEKAENDNVIATPTLILTHPEPIKRFIGDLSNKQKIIQNLDIEINTIV